MGVDGGKGGERLEDDWVGTYSWPWPHLGDSAIPSWIPPRTDRKNMRRCRFFGRAQWKACVQNLKCQLSSLLMLAFCVVVGILWRRASFVYQLCATRISVRHKVLTLWQFGAYHMTIASWTTGEVGSTSALASRGSFISMCVLRFSGMHHVFPRLEMRVLLMDAVLLIWLCSL